MQLVKLGGSVLTDKSAYRTPRLDAIARLAYEIAASGEKIVVVHGAGSYGHVLAKQHDLAAGDTGPDSRLAAAQVHADVRELNALVLTALRDAGLAPMTISTYDIARLTQGKLANFAFDPLHETLTRSFTPVLHGDVVLDHSRGFGILSGDVLMVELARLLRPSRAIFVTDVDGIYDKDPHASGAQLLPRIDTRMDIRDSETRVPDITGSMAGKLQRARDVAKAGVPVQIVNGLAHGRLADALAGKDVICTHVLA